MTIDGEATPFLRWGRAGEITLVLPPELARRLTVTTQQQVGVVFAQADLDQLIARTDDGAVVLSGSARHIEITTSTATSITRDAIAVSESFTRRHPGRRRQCRLQKPTETVDGDPRNGDIDSRCHQPGPYLVDATTGHEWGATEVRVPRTGTARPPPLSSPHDRKTANVSVAALDVASGMPDISRASVSRPSGPVSSR